MNATEGEEEEEETPCCVWGFQFIHLPHVLRRRRRNKKTKRVLVFLFSFKYSPKTVLCGATRKTFHLSSTRSFISFLFGPPFAARPTARSGIFSSYGAAIHCLNRARKKSGQCSSFINYLKKKPFLYFLRNTFCHCPCTDSSSSLLIFCTCFSRATNNTRTAPESPS